MTDTLPKVSVVCAWYNRADYVRDTVDSLLAQEYPNFDITLVNDGSPDPRVREILDSYDDPRLRVIHQENTGFTRAIRRAIDESDGTYIAIQGAGDISLPGRLSAQSNFLRQNRQVVVVGCYYFDIQIDDSGRELKRSAVTNSAAKNLKSIISANIFSHGETMFRRSTYCRVGGYRPIFINAQDRDLWLRMVRHGELNVVEDFFYHRRQFKQDGISTSVSKTMRQIILSELAKYTAKQRDYCSYDPIDILGVHSLACMQRSNRIALAFIFFAIVEKFHNADEYNVYRAMARKYSMLSYILSIFLIDLRIGELILTLDKSLVRHNKGRGLGFWRRFERFLRVS